MKINKRMCTVPKMFSAMNEQLHTNKIHTSLKLFPLKHASHPRKVTLENSTWTNTRINTQISCTPVR